jgi:DNA-binding transcriptional MerR regulator
VSTTTSPVTQTADVALNKAVMNGAPPEPCVEGGQHQQARSRQDHDSERTRHELRRATRRAAVLHSRRQTRGRPWSGAAVRTEFRRSAGQAGVRRRFTPHQLRHAHALELAREGVPLNIIQRQLGHTNLGTTSIYLQRIDPEEIITAVRTRRPPMMSVSSRTAALIDGDGRDELERRRALASPGRNSRLHASRRRSRGSSVPLV